MKHTIKTLEVALKALAAKHKSRKGFNHAVGKKFGFINDGAFRCVYDAETYVIKLRQHENRSSFDDEDIDMANEQEAQNYEELMVEAPSVAFFVLAPIYIALPNGHDAILMRKVSVVANDEHYADIMGSDDECYGLNDYAAKHFTDLMQEQLEFITGSFCDSHDNNIGWDMATGRVWFIDYNHGANTCEREPDSRREAKRLVKRVTQSSRKAKAAA
jgi:hypothetical protein